MNGSTKAKAKKGDKTINENVDIRSYSSYYREGVGAFCDLELKDNSGHWGARAETLEILGYTHQEQQ